MQVRIDRDADGAATVHVAAERADTLRLLVADQDTLHRTLDSAGLPQESRTLNFSLSDPATGGRTASDSGGGSGFAGTGGFAGQGGSQQGGSSRQDRSAYPVPAALAAASSGWLRAGVDITA